jgi:hypothetical protein
MRGTIEQVWENESKKGQKYFNVQIGGERYSVWDEKYFSRLQQGAEVEYDVRQSGRFRHLTEVKPVDGNGNGNGHGNGNGQANGGSEEGYRFNGKDTQIARMSCLKSASEIVAPHQADPVTKRTLVVDAARYFERYVFGEDLLDFPPEGAGQGGEKGAGSTG